MFMYEKMTLQLNSIAFKSKVLYIDKKETSINLDNKVQFKKNSLGMYKINL